MPNKRKQVKIGDTFGFWSVISDPVYKLYGIKNPQKCQFVYVKCICGKEKEIKVGCLKHKKSKSCGCKKRYFDALNNPSHTHWGSFTRLYKLWQNMKSRCYNPKASKYRLWGGKGIRVCEEWHNFLTFKQWSINNGYNDNLTINRKNSNLNYCPENCEWVTKQENGNVVKWRDELIKKLQLENALLKQKLNEKFHVVS